MVILQCHINQTVFESKPILPTCEPFCCVFSGYPCIKASSLRSASCTQLCTQIFRATLNEICQFIAMTPQRWHCSILYLFDDELVVSKTGYRSSYPHRVPEEHLGVGTKELILGVSPYSVCQAEDWKGSLFQKFPRGLRPGPIPG